ncbi:epoxide hydrolase 4 [Parasteatoda tepidariorum]|uniref:epoxide hydrolase 4 n=1 Tax=Parasteatoda tepidariorum TaxID=114398 RepID=UPI00077FB387|nr:uncharacterized protein LOC107440239 [Parasteatoda tepidariorum]
MSCFRYTPIKMAHKVFETLRGKSNDKCPVIFMHGLMESKETWRRVPERVANKTKRKVYAFDARNHGESEHTMVSNFDNNLYDLYHFMDTMKIEKSILVGHSMGGMTAIKAALDQPSRVEMVFSVNMHTDKIHPEIINRWLFHLLRLADGYCTFEINKPNMAFVTEPPSNEKMRKNEKLYNSVHVFRCLALSDALLEFDAAQPTTHLNGKYPGPAYFIFGPRNILCGKRLYTLSHIKHFPEAEVIPMTDYSNDLFRDKKLANALCETILHVQKFI